MKHLGGTNIGIEHVAFILGLETEECRMPWKELVGLEHVRQRVEEEVIWPQREPTLFKSRALQPGRGLLLFGPPGSGKSSVGRAIATDLKARFFSVTPSTFSSKFEGESEILIHALFAVARLREPFWQNWMV